MRDKAELPQESTREQRKVKSQHLGMLVTIGYFETKHTLIVLCSCVNLLSYSKPHLTIIPQLNLHSLEPYYKS